MTLLFKERQLLGVCLPKAAVISFTWKIIPSKLERSWRLYSFLPHMLNKMKIFRSLMIVLCQTVNSGRKDWPWSQNPGSLSGLDSDWLCCLGGKSINISETLPLQMQSGMIISDFQVCSEAYDKCRRTCSCRHQALLLRGIKKWPLWVYITLWEKPQN